MNASLVEQTRSEWRQLGFFYESDDNRKEWRFTGSRAGLLAFVKLLRSYVADPLNSAESEHEHYGPYMYLKVITSSVRVVDEQGVHGSLHDLAVLASVAERAIGDLPTGGSVRLHDEFAPTSDYAIVLNLRADDFDPASLDEQLSANTGPTKGV